MKEFFASNRLSAYIDGELTAAEMAEMDRALRENPPLQQEYERLLATVEYVRSAGPVQAPADFHSKILAATANEPMPGGFWRRFRGFFAGIPMETVAVAMAAVLVTIVIGQKMDSVESPEVPEVSATTGEPELASRSGNKVDTAVKEMAELVQRGSEMPVEKAPKDAVATLGTRGGKGIDPEQVGEVLKSTATGVQDDGIAALIDEPTAGDVEKRTYIDGDLDQVLTSAMSYRLHVDDPRAVRFLAKAAAKHGGVVSLGGKPVDSSFTFDDTTTRAQLAVQIPSNKLADFYGELGALGEVEQVSGDSSPLYSADTLVVSVDVMYAP